MIINNLEILVAAEAIGLLLVILVIIATFKRWRWTLLVSSALATIVFGTVWSWTMTLASALVYVPCSTLVWWQLEQKGNKPIGSRKCLQIPLLAMLAIGVAIIISYNLNKIYIYLG